MSNLKENYLNFFVFFYLFAYISGPAIINIYVTLTSIVCLFFIIKNRRKLYNYFHFDSSSLILLTFFFYIFFLGLFKNNFNYEIISFFRFIVIFIFISSYSYKIQNNLDIKIIFIFFIIVISLDSIFQFYFGENIIGYKIFDNYRLTSFFNDEPIVGSFLLKLTVPTLAIFLLDKNKRLFYLVIILISSFVIVVSGERMPILQYLISIFFMIFFLKEKKLSITTLFLTLMIIFYVVLSNNILSDRYKSTISSINNILFNNNFNNQFENVSVNHYLLNFKSGLNIWSNSKIFGNGYRYYNKNCHKYYNEYLIEGCSTHPHNIYIELLSDYGLIGLSIFSLFIFSLLFQFFKINFNKNTVGLGFVFIAISFPLATSQSIFSSYYGSIYFFIIFLLKFYCLEKK